MPPPTFWEAAADAIIEQKSFSASMDVCEPEVEKDNISSDIMNIESNREEVHNTDVDKTECTKEIQSEPTNEQQNLLI